MSYPNNANTYLPGVIFIPSALQITAITRSFPMEITFTVPVNGSNTYIAGQNVKLNIPKPYGMSQANGLIGTIQTVTSTTMTLDIDSRLFDAFSIPASTAVGPPTLAPAGSRNLEYNNDSNQVAFQPLNNRGN